MGAGTALELYNAPQQYQQHNASSADCITSSAKSQRRYRNTGKPASWNVLGSTDVLYLENYEELRNLVCARTKIWILTHKNIFRKSDS